LSFPIAGKVAAVYVQAGDRVDAGQVLAELEDLDQLQASLTLAELELKSAKQALEDLQNNATASLAGAQLALAEAKKAYEDAQSGLKQKGMPRCDQETTDAYYAAYMQAQDYLERLGDGGGNQDYYLRYIVPAKDNVLRAFATYQYCAGFTDYEIDSSHAQLILAETQVKKAEDDLKTLEANNGIDPDELALAENSLANAQLAYEKAQKNLEGARLRAPFAGTILSVAGQAGDEVGAETFITLADLLHPELEFVVDETDIDKVAAGNAAQVVFDAFPNQTFNGKVTRVNPALETVSGYQAIKGLIQLDLGAEPPKNLLLEGMNASVEIIGGRAENALLVPVEAVRDLGDGQYGVFVVSQDGRPRLKVVEIGLMDAVYAEIEQGLETGEVVTTGVMETN